MSDVNSRPESDSSSPPPLKPLPVASRRWENTGEMNPAIMAVYSAIVGKMPEIDPTVVNEDLMQFTGETQPQRHWSPIVLSIYLKEMYRQGQVALNTAKPEIAAWIRRQSIVARRRLTETQTRIASVHRDRAA